MTWLGLTWLSAEVTTHADSHISRIWFLNTLTGLYTQYLRSRRSRDPTEEREDEWKTRKLLCDLVFVCELHHTFAPSITPC